MAYAIGVRSWLCAGAIALVASGHSLSADIRTLQRIEGLPVVQVTGEFAFGDEKKFVTEVLPLQDAIVEFDSPGGNLQAGIEIGRAIRLKGFTTSVRARAICASACGFAWLGGIRREVQEGGSVGFHAAYTLEAGVAKETGVGNAVLGSYLNQLGLTQRAIEYATIAAPESMMWLTKADGDALGIGFSLVPPRLPDEERVLTETDSAPSGIQKEDQTIEVVDNPPPTPVPVRPVTDIRRSEGPAKVAEPWSRGTFSSAPKLDILGCDLGDARREITLAECESQCSLERKCSAYTYQVSKKACFLKSCAVWAVTNEDFTSGLDRLAQSAVTRLGFTLKYGVDLTGGDFRNLQADTLVDCVRACRDDAECKALSYVGRRKQCWLKNSGFTKTDNRKVVSGIKDR